MMDGLSGQIGEGLQRTPNVNGERTRLRILDAAERLFSEHGLDGVSMRDIASAAHAPLALANYHFGSKDQLYSAVFRRRIGPVSEERRALLAQIFSQDAEPSIAQVLDALARPWVEMRERSGGIAYARLVAREIGDPLENHRGIVGELLDPIARDFIAAMSRALPHHSRSHVNWAYHFFVGGLLLILANPQRVQRLSGRVCDVKNSATVINQLVAFYSAAFEALPPCPHKPKRESQSPRKRNRRE